MRILALEFSSDARSVAVIEGPPARAGAPVVRGRAAQSAGRATRAFALITAALREAGLEREDIDTLAVGLGPGSYTGIRLALAVAQGWQLARPVRVLGVDSVEVLAARAHQEGLRGPVTFLLDAQRGEFYAAQQELAAAGSRVTRPLWLARAEEGAALAAGPGTLVVEPALAARFPGARILEPEAGLLGLRAAARGPGAAGPAEALEPVYLRPDTFVKAPPPRVLPPTP
ncbi:MAG: tRNA ((37)-N6)-threonylcarbamoyltransferase complex dimerization subunit type 1 TsaB [Verrucomicrobiota bacterium]